MAVVTESWVCPPDIERVRGLMHSYFAAQRSTGGGGGQIEAKKALGGLADMVGVNDLQLRGVMDRIAIATMGIGGCDRVKDSLVGKVTGSVGIDWLLPEIAETAWRAR